MHATTHHRVLVIDAQIRQSLAACRGLGRGGHAVGAAGYGRPPLAAWSRYATRYHTLPEPTGPGRAFGDALRGLVEREGYDAVVASDDPTLARLRWLGPDFATVPAVTPAFDLLVDKIGLTEVAVKAEVSYPTTIELDTPAALERAAREIGLPMIVKAGRSALASDERVLYAAGATVAHDLESAADAATEIAATGFRPIAQQRVWSREKVNAVVIRRDGRSELRYAHRVLRELPAAGGTGITLETASPHDEDTSTAIAALERICEAAGYEGLVQAEFYYDRASGKAWLIDVNPRLWGSTWFVESLGLRVVEHAVAVAVGTPVPPRTAYPVGRRFHHLKAEVAWFRAHADHGSAGAMLAAARGVRRGDVCEYVDPTDLRPFLSYPLDRLSRRIGLSPHLASTR